MRRSRSLSRIWKRSLSRVWVVWDYTEVPVVIGVARRRRSAEAIANRHLATSKTAQRVRAAMVRLDTYLAPEDPYQAPSFDKLWEG